MILKVNVTLLVCYVIYTYPSMHTCTIQDAYTMVGAAFSQFINELVLEIALMLCVNFACRTEAKDQSKRKEKKGKKDEKKEEKVHNVR